RDRAEADPPGLPAVEGEAEQVPVAVEDQRGAVERPVRRLVQHGRGLVDDPVLPGVAVEHMDPAAPAGGEGAGHGDVLVTRGRGASRPFWPLTARAHSAVVSPPARDEAASRAAVRRSRRRSYAAPP